MNLSEGMATALAGFALAFAGAVCAGVPLLRWLRRAGVRQTVSEDAPERHATKQGTPTMGGLMMGAGLAVACLALGLAGRLTDEAAVVVSLALVFGAIGFVDDALIVRRGKNLGLTARQKLLLQVVAAACFAVWLGSRWDATDVLGLRMGWWYYPVWVIMAVGLSNATNLADGLDGLASGMSMVVFLGMGLAALSMLRAGVGVPSLMLAGSCAGLLWFNCNPAQVFMGNTGSLALGAAMAGIAALGNMEASLQLAAIVFWAEALSVMAQVGVFKWRRRTKGLEYARAHRLFRRAPLHHHFEELGWPETRIVARFWLVTGLATALAMAVVVLGAEG